MVLDGEMRGLALLLDSAIKMYLTAVGVGVRVCVCWGNFFVCVGV